MVLGFSWSNKTWWKPLFPMDSRPLVKGCIANLTYLLTFSSFCLLDNFFFSFFKKSRIFGYSWSTRKPRFPMDQRPLVKGCIANFDIFLDIFEFLRFRWFFPFFKQFGFWGILGQPGIHASRSIRDLWSKGVLLILASL